MGFWRFLPRTQNHADKLPDRRSPSNIRKSSARPERHRVSFALLIDETGDEACIGLSGLRADLSFASDCRQTGAQAGIESHRQKRGWAEDFTLDLEACIFCELCVQVCPTDAIVMCRAPSSPDTVGRLGPHDGQAVRKPEAKPLSWGTGGKLMKCKIRRAAKPNQRKAAGTKNRRKLAQKNKKVAKQKLPKPLPNPPKEAAPAAAKETRGRDHGFCQGTSTSDGRKACGGCGSRSQTDRSSFPSECAGRTKTDTAEQKPTGGPMIEQSRLWPRRWLHCAGGPFWLRGQKAQFTACCGRWWCPGVRCCTPCSKRRCSRAFKCFCTSVA